MSAVYKAIAAVQGELAKVGIAKSRRNKQGEGFMFRGIDDVYAALSPLLSANGLCIIPRVISRGVTERQSRSGSTLHYVTVHAEFDFVSAEDGSCHTAATFGEAMDSGDKATNKAMSAAYKYAAFMTFAIPTEGDNDADATTHEVAPRVDAGRGQSQTGTVSPSPISKAQADELGKIADEVEADKARFCAHFGITSMVTLPASRFDEAKAMLERKRKVAA